MRKTFNIKWLVNYVNKFNAESADDLKEARAANNTLLETVLMDARAYKGFNYLGAEDLRKDAMSVGVREQKPDGSWNFDDTDYTRVYYYMPEGL